MPVRRDELDLERYARVLLEMAMADESVIESRLEEWRKRIER